MLGGHQPAGVGERRERRHDGPGGQQVGPDDGFQTVCRGLVPHRQGLPLDADVHPVPARVHRRDLLPRRGLGLRQEIAAAAAVAARQVPGGIRVDRTPRRAVQGRPGPAGRRRRGTARRMRRSERSGSAPGRGTECSRADPRDAGHRTPDRSRPPCRRGRSPRSGARPAPRVPGRSARPSRRSREQRGRRSARRPVDARCVCGEAGRGTHRWRGRRSPWGALRRGGTRGRRSGGHVSIAGGSLGSTDFRPTAGSGR